MGDREQPPPQVPVVPQVRVGAQRREHRLLEAVGALVGPDLGDTEAVQVGAVSVEELLEGRQVHVRSTPRRRSA